MNRFYGLVIVLLAAAVLCSVTSAQTASAGKNGNWNADTTWVGGVVPTASTDVVIAAGDTVTLDNVTAVDHACANLTVNGVLLFPKVPTVTSLTVNGNLTVSSGATLRVQTRDPAGSYVEHVLTIYGDFVSSGVTDFRLGSNGSTGQGLLLNLRGSTNSIISLNPQLSYDKNINEMNAIVIDKTNGAKVICQSNVYQSNNSSTGPGHLTLRQGFIETGSYRWVLFSSASNTLNGGSDTSYVIGCLGRGLPTGTPGLRFYPIGDSKGYRPISLRQVTSGSTGSHMEVRCVEGDANASTPVLSGGIDKLSSIRYYQVTLDSISYGVNFSVASLSYGNTDGVAAGNTNLRVAYSKDTMLTWIAMGPTVWPHTTVIGSTPTTMISDTLTSPIPGGAAATKYAMYFTLARATGTTENSLDYTPTSVLQESAAPAGFALAQNYPNPFNPSTTIRFSLENKGFVTLRVFDMLGREVKALVQQEMNPGRYAIDWNASGETSGMYFSVLKSGDKSVVRKMILIK